MKFIDRSKIKKEILKELKKDWKNKKGEEFSFKRFEKTQKNGLNVRKLSNDLRKYGKNQVLSVVYDLADGGVVFVSPQHSDKSRVMVTEKTFDSFLRECDGAVMKHDATRSPLALFLLLLMIVAVFGGLYLLVDRVDESELTEFNWVVNPSEAKTSLELKK